MENTPPDPPAPPSSTYASRGTVGTDGWGAEGDRLAAAPPAGFKIASLIMMILGGALFVTGLFPCLGWLNWFGVPINGIAVLVGILGLASGPKNPDGTRAYQGYYAAALIVGGVGFIGGVLRCVAGAGLL